MYHKAVLYDEVMQYMINEKYNVYMDCTLGGAGHSYGILTNSNDNSVLIGIDQDINAINYSKQKLECFGDRVKIFKNNFQNLKLVSYLAGYDKVDAILMDIGVSSKQFDDKNRGFSYRFDAKLDMRMDESINITAYDVVNTFSEKQLEDIIYKYGQEPKARKIANYIVKQREIKPIESTFELSDLIIRAVGKKMKKHPAKRTFQALRIYVNNELEVLQKAIDDAISILNENGRLLIITFHSLEDKIVKEKFRYYENPCICPKDLPICVCNKKPIGKIINKKGIAASSLELEQNNRAHSAKLRIFEKGKEL